MEDSYFKKLIKKYNNNTANAAERFVVDLWYDSFDADLDAKIPGLSNQEEKHATRLRILNRIDRRQPRLHWYRSSWLRIAALCLLISGIALFFIPNHTQEPLVVKLPSVYSTGQKEIKRILLTDSTVIWLNANSNVSITSDFGKKERKLFLKGEASFDVRRDTLRPFIVDAGKIKVRVLGTAFNVRAYEQLNEIKVSVSRGKVKVSDDLNALALLTKGTSLSYDKLSRAAKVENAAVTDTWMDGKIVLVKASFPELVQDMHNMYGLKLSTTDKQVKSFRYNVTLRASQSQKEVLELLMNMLNKKYKQEGENEIIIY
ncbi:hypothetical protein AQ505_11770 [Pedobacter sp. PACM 27299]|uniref:FecR family protein n=1 Tax=Pedobacter sp. PACM 27299 TaxID=1727164 RepID=UPI0007057F9C|nr:FecR family protein [Pedobacter sp. PACM 27299]ALL06109.1 hypothetical protein AQ505_11770 [Pedobacter sp. PACM 27299]